MSRATPEVVVRIVILHFYQSMGLCVYVKLGGLSAGVRPPPAVDHATVQYSGINIRATQVS